MKMHKLLITAAGLALSLNAAATDTSNGFTTGGTTTVQDTTSACPLLNETVKVNLSKNVAGGYGCAESTNKIAVVTCHPNGKKNLTSNNFYQGVSSGGAISAVQDAACDTTKATSKAAALSTSSS